MKTFIALLAAIVVAVYIFAPETLPFGLGLSQNVPRASNEDFMAWLVGQSVTVEKGIIFDDRWRIEKGQITDFKLIKVANNKADKIYTATIAFRASANGRGIQVNEAMLRYRNAIDANNLVSEDKLQFVDFVPISVSRIGG